MDVGVAPEVDADVVASLVDERRLVGDEVVEQDAAERRAVIVDRRPQQPEVRVMRRLVPQHGEPIAACTARLLVGPGGHAERRLSTVHFQVGRNTVRSTEQEDEPITALTLALNPRLTAVRVTDAPLTRLHANTATYRK